MILTTSLSLPIPTSAETPLFPFALDLAYNTLEVITLPLLEWCSSQKQARNSR